MAKILLSLPDDLLAEIDSYCKDFHYDRSEFIRNCVRGRVFPEKEEVIPQEEVDENSETPKNFPEIKDTNLGFCPLTLGHPFQRGVERRVGQITVWDANGEIANLGRVRLDGAWVCEQCIEKLRDLISKEGGRIDGMV